jgi:hypothetical protein
MFAVFPAPYVAAGGAPTTLNLAITATGDDRYDVVGVGLGADDVGLISGQSGGVDAVAGWRFQNVTIPNAATINSAEFSVEVTGVSGTPQLEMHGNDVDDAAVWGAGNLPSNITQTTAATTVDDYTSTGVKTTDVTAIVQEIINRAGWASGNDLALVLFDDQATDENFAAMADLLHATAQEGRLSINYT